MQENMNVLWTLIATILVFFMQAGFALVELGLTRSKNAINIIMKNLMDFSIGSISFFLIGFGLMFGQSNGFFGSTDFMLSGVTGEAFDYTFILFQTVFAGTAATIVSGAMAERTRFGSYLILSFFITTFIYPISGSWAWGSLHHGKGFLESLPTGAFIDFAGSTVVHSMGGWLAFCGAWILGPRIGKFTIDGKVRAIPGHNIPFAALGVFILWFAWFGFNAGSTTTSDLSIGRIAFITNLSAISGVISALILTQLLYKVPDASMTLNGALAGLVGITAGCADVTPIGAIIIGTISGLLVVLSISFIENKLKIDDPVGAISVHGVCGAWGTIAVGLFSAQASLGVGDKDLGLFYGGGFSQLGSQLIGVLVYATWGMITGYLLFTLLKHLRGIRVNEDYERRGLDITEHQAEAYYTTK
jgi:Amt family ammonium transporter